MKRSLLPLIMALLVGSPSAHGNLLIHYDAAEMPVGSSRTIHLELVPGVHVAGGGVTFEYDPSDIAVQIVGMDFGSFGGPTQAVHMVRAEPGRIVFGVSRFQGLGYTAPVAERIAYLTITRLNTNPFTIQVSDGFVGEDGGTQFQNVPLSDIAIGSVPEDSDGDGIADAWEYFWFGNLTTAGVGTDFDGDGVSDLNHSLNGTNPRIPYLINDPAIAAASLQPAQGRLALTMPTDANVQYRLQITESLYSPIWPDAFFFLTPALSGSTNILIGTGNPETIYLPLPATEPWFYRIQVRE